MCVELDGFGGELVEVGGTVGGVAVGSDVPAQVVCDHEDDVGLSVHGD